MKFLTSPQLFNLNQELVANLSGQPHVHSHVEVLQIERQDVAPKGKVNRTLSAPVRTGGNDLLSPSHHLRALKAAMSYAFPDYDWGCLCPWSFKAIQSIDQARMNLTWPFSRYFQSPETVTRMLWSVVEQEMDLKTCDIYMYEPESTDPFSEGGDVFTLNYFFYNESSQKMLMLHISEGAGNLGDYSDMMQSSDSFDPLF